MTNSDTIAADLRRLANDMIRISNNMRYYGGFGNSKKGKLLLQHAEEMQGAAEMCIDWVYALESENEPNV